jgi:hypothetical protein
MPARNFSQWILKISNSTGDREIRISAETAHDLGSALPVVFASAQDVTPGGLSFDCTSGWLKAHRAFASDRITDWTVTERFPSAGTDRIHVSAKSAKAAAEAFGSKVGERVAREIQASLRARAILEATAGI